MHRARVCLASSERLGVIARALLPGRCKTRLAKELGAPGAAHLHRCMLLDTLEAFGALCFADHVVLVAPEDDGKTVLERIAPPGWRVVEERGANLGARLTHAAAELGAEHPVLLVGNDSPTRVAGIEFGQPGQLVESTSTSTQCEWTCCQLSVSRSSSPTSARSL